MLPKFKYEIVNGARFPRFVGNLTHRIKDWRGFWVSYFLPRYIERIQQNFETEGELSSRAGWPELNPTYAAWKARHFPGTKILERTRRLRNSLSHGATGSDTALQVRPLQLVYGSRVPYAKYHRWERPFILNVTQKEATSQMRAWLREQKEKAARES